MYNLVHLLHVHFHKMTISQQHAHSSFLPQFSVFIESIAINFGFIILYMIIYINTSIPQTNTFQGILITNGFQSYTVFTYRCTLLQWSGDATIGFRAAGEFFENYAISGNASSVGCENADSSSWTNIIYQLSKSLSCYSSLDIGDRL